MGMYKPVDYPPQPNGIKLVSRLTKAIAADFWEFKNSVAILGKANF
ncbi:hypothetical protein [Nostoc sp.]